MRSPICEALGIDVPIFAFTPSEHVAAAVSRAGGLGVLGAVRFNDADELDKAPTWLDENTAGKHYGVHVALPMNIPTDGKAVDLTPTLPEQHISFLHPTLTNLSSPPSPAHTARAGI